MRLRDEVNRLMEERLKELTAERVKNLIEAGLYKLRIQLQ